MELRMKNAIAFGVQSLGSGGRSRLFMGIRGVIMRLVKLISILARSPRPSK